MELMKIIEQYQLRENLSLLLQNSYNEEELDKKEELIEYIIRFIVEIVTEQDDYQNINFDDLFQEVYLSVCESLNKATSNFNGGFEGFLKLDLKERIQLYFIKEKLKNSNLSRDLCDDLRHYTSTVEKLTKELERKPTTQEIASFLNKSIKERGCVERRILLFFVNSSFFANIA
jgi:DNA-directed RNA polymerase specialized sigma subunit